jgi:hypothetical protein
MTILRNEDGSFSVAIRACGRVIIVEASTRAEAINQAIEMAQAKTCED